MTEKYMISPNFSKDSNEIISKALELSHLPEGVSAVCWDESVTAQKPFVVIAHVPRWKDARTAMYNGAIRYVKFRFNPSDLAEDLDR